MIQGVTVKYLRRIDDDRGFLMEILRSDWPEFKQFGQVYMTCCNPGVVKGWHYHLKQTDNMCVVHGTARIVLFDARKDSETSGKIQEVMADNKEPKLIQIPPGVYHGFESATDDPCFIVNTPTELYNYTEPDEHRVAFDSPDVPYTWRSKKGG